MVCQRSIREAEPAVLGGTDVVEDAAAVQRPEPKVTNHHRHHGPDLDAWTTGECVYPTDVELLPCSERGARALIVISTVAENDCLFVETKAGRPIGDDARRPVR